MRLAPIVARLIEHAPALGGRVLAALSGATPSAYPAAYVLLLSESVVDGVLAGPARIIDARFGVELMVRHAAQASSGGPAHDHLEDVRESVLAALVGHTPGGGVSPIAHMGGKLISYEAGLAVWRDEYSVTFTR